MLLNKLNKPPRWHIELFVIPENKRYTEGHILILKGNKSQIFKQRMSFDWNTEHYPFVGVYQTAKLMDIRGFKCDLRFKAVFRSFVLQYRLIVRPLVKHQKFFVLQIAEIDGFSFGNRVVLMNAQLQPKRLY